MGEEKINEEIINDPDIHMIDQDEEGFWVECNVCKSQYKNWYGSTPCCGSIAWMVEDNKPTKKISLFGSISNGPFEPIIIDMN